MNIRILRSTIVLSIAACCLAAGTGLAQETHVNATSEDDESSLFRMPPEKANTEVDESRPSPELKRLTPEELERLRKLLNPESEEKREKPGGKTRRERTRLQREIQDEEEGDELPELRSRRSRFDTCPPASPYDSYIRIRSVMPRVNMAPRSCRPPIVYYMRPVYSVRVPRARYYYNYTTYGHGDSISECSR